MIPIPDLFVPVAALPGGQVADTAIEWGSVIQYLLGGLALFLFGMDQMAKGLQSAAGDQMKQALARLTRTPILGALTGAFVTAVLNSSSVTTVLVVGFITAGLMTLSQSIGVIMGANIGSTFTAQIIAFNVTEFALVLVAAGFAMLFVGKRERVQNLGGMVMGLGLVFYGMGVMGEATLPLRSYPPFLDLMSRLDNPLLGILVGAVFTGLVQSSAATTGIAIVMASEGLVSLPAGIALAFGANIGTCATAILASMGKPVEARRAAMAHVLFNVLGVLLWVGFIDYLAEFVAWLSPQHVELEGRERMAAEVPRQIANAHTVFNVANTLLFIGLTGPLARLVVRLVPARSEDERRIVRPRYLDDALLLTPSLALQAVRREVGHLGEIAERMLARVGDGSRPFDVAEVSWLGGEFAKLDVLHDRTVDYLGRITRKSLTDQDGGDFVALMSAAGLIEAVGEIIVGGMSTTREDARRNGVQPSEAMRQTFVILHDSVARAFSCAVRAIRDDDERAAQEALSLKHDVKMLIEDALRHQLTRLSEDDPKRPLILRLEMEFVDSLKRVHDVARRVAKLVIPKGMQTSVTA